MKIKEFHQAIIFRKKGFSLKEISDKLNVSKGTVSVWVRDIELSPEAMVRLETKISKGQIISADRRKAKTAKILDDFLESNLKLLDNSLVNKTTLKIYCGIMYWCEGGKYDNRIVQFTNSDPSVISTFLNLFRLSFDLDEQKFRACIHLHSYHSKETQLKYWSGITAIPSNQFIKPFKKKNSGKRIRPNYQGCLQLRYCDANIARDLLMTGKAFLTKYGSLG